ncbi:MAG: sulfotransferase [Bacteroidota bacterium]
MEKTPRHIHHLAKIWRVYPDAKIILLVRDGRDVACSIKKRYGSFEKGVTRWLADNEAARPFWQHSQLYQLRLEDLQQQTEVSLRKLCEFLGISFEETMLQFHEKKRFFYAPHISYSDGQTGEEQHAQRRNWQINQPLKSTTARWMSEMTEAEKMYFKREAQYLLEEFGYVNHANW